MTGIIYKISNMFTYCNISRFAVHESSVLWLSTKNNSKNLSWAVLRSTNSRVNAPLFTRVALECVLHFTWESCHNLPRSHLVMSISSPPFIDLNYFPSAALHLVKTCNSNLGLDRSRQNRNGQEGYKSSPDFSVFLLSRHLITICFPDDSYACTVAPH